jgi:hypothetical protein
MEKLTALNKSRENVEIKEERGVITPRCTAISSSLNS